MRGDDQLAAPGSAGSRPQAPEPRIASQARPPAPAWTQAGRRKIIADNRPGAMPLTIDDFRERPEFMEVLADRLWRAFHQDSGGPIEAIRTPLKCLLLSRPALPFCLIAHVNDIFVGTASAMLIESDVCGRPLLTPWLAAVWVDASHRQQGVGTALMEAVVQRAAAQGERRLFAQASEVLRPFYEKRNWRLFESQVPGPGQHILCRDTVS